MNVIEGRKFGTNYNKHQFDDSLFLKYMEDQIKVVEIRVYESNGVVCGIQFFYKYRESIVTNLHCSVPVDLSTYEHWIDYNTNLLTYSCLNLEDGEYVKTVKICGSAKIEKITFITNKNNSLSIGENNSSESTVNIPDGNQLVGFKGSHATKIHQDKTNWGIHDLTVLYAKI